MQESLSNSFLLQYNCKYALDFALSLLLPSIFSIVLKILSKTFFSMCIMSKLCLIIFVFQYGKSQKILPFRHPNFFEMLLLTSSASTYVTFINPNSSISCKISSPDLLSGGGARTTLFLRNLCLLRLKG